jgi:hypothetical protein
MMPIGLASRAGVARGRGEAKRLERPPHCLSLEKRIREALAAPDGPGCAS